MHSDSRNPFFASPENLETLRLFSRILRPEVGTDRPANTIAHALLQVIELMISNAARFDEYCPANIEWIGDHFMRELREFAGLPADKRPPVVSSVFTSAFRFLCELEFTQPADPSFEVRQIGNFVDENIEMFTGTDRQQLTFARYAMPVQLAKKLLNDPSIAEFRRFAETVSQATKLKADWDSELMQRENIVKALKEGLKDATSSYNFVGLVDGFRNLAKGKIVERRISFWSLIGLAAIMIGLLVVQISYVFTHIESIEAKNGMLLYTLPTIGALEVILVYFFRVVLTQFRSVKAQVLQLDLRIALCQFIQSYAEYAAKVKKDDPNALSRFESVVFSSLMPDNETIPSTFDGTEKLASLIKSIRGT